jgi:hypothetical protein
VNQVESVGPAKAPAWSLRILLLICAGALSVIILFTLEDVIHAVQARQTAATPPPVGICKMVAETFLTMPQALQMRIKAQCEMSETQDIQ